MLSVKRKKKLMTVWLKDSIFTATFEALRLLKGVRDFRNGCFMRLEASEGIGVWRRIFRVGGRKKERNWTVWLNHSIFIVTFDVFLLLKILHNHFSVL